MYKVLILAFLMFVSTQRLLANDIVIDYKEINTNIVTIILKSYADLVDSSQVLDKEMRRVCLRKIPTIDRNLKKHFIDLRMFWSKAQLINFGPISFLERRERFDYWPDKHRVGERQLRKLLNQEELLMWEIDNFREKSVAVQGLSALERLLFSTNQYLNENHCTLATLITANLVDIAVEVSAQWSQKPIEFKNDLLNPIQDVTFFSSSKQVTSTILNDMSTQLRFLSDIKITNALPKSNKKQGNYRKLESWRTGHSFTLMRTNIMMIENYYTQGFAAHLIQYHPKVHQKIMSLLKRARRIINLLDTQPEPDIDFLSKQMKQQENLDYLQSLKEVLIDIERVFKQEIVKAFHLTVKFNALDGD